MPTVLFIDPGNEQSAACFLFESNVEARILPNNEMADFLKGYTHCAELVGIEMVACYGMPVGKEVFDTARWVGRFEQILSDKGKSVQIVYRQQIKLHHCHTMKAKDGNIAQALRDRFGGKGTKGNPGFFYGFKDDMWQACAGAVYLRDKLTNNS